MKENKNGFTLLELLVVVVIIGVLAAIALPQYKKVVERSQMAEAVTVVKSIAQAQQRYYLSNGKYADCYGLNSLDVDITGTNGKYCSRCPAKITSNFVYASGPCNAGIDIAIAQRNPEGKRYYIYMLNSRRIRCYAYQTATDIQKELCSKLNASGTL